VAAILLCHHRNATPEATQTVWESKSEALLALAELTPCDHRCVMVHDIYWSQNGKIRGLSYGKIPYRLNGRAHDRPKPA
jgi:hypothetical protein